MSRTMVFNQSVYTYDILPNLFFNKNKQAIKLYQNTNLSISFDVLIKDVQVMLNKLGFGLVGFYDKLAFESDDMLILFTIEYKKGLISCVSIPTIYGNNFEAMKSIVDMLEKNKLENDEYIQIQWVKDEKCTIINTAVKYNPSKFSNNVYPYIKQGADQYIKDFIASDASLLVLIGPPGTGKTSFIRELIYQSETEAMVCYDEDILNTDNIFSTFISSYHANIFVLEDADNFLKPRKEGNKMMSRFLNVGDGLVSMPHKKIVFSTNLPSISDIDPALTRAGRCYGVLQFRELNKEEAIAVCGENIPQKDKFSLGELFNHQSSIGNSKVNKVGFY